MLPSTPVDSSASASARLTSVWHGVHESTELSENEKEMNEITDTTKIIVHEASSDDGPIGFVKGILTDSGVQAAGKAAGKAIVDSIPFFMRMLEALTDVHPFLKAAYLPFKQIYYQETKRRDNDKKRTMLFETLKDTILLLRELEHIGKDDTRTTPTGEPILGRLATICNNLENDIKDCYNVVDAQKKHRLAIKFLRASNWNEKLATYTVTFKKRQDEIHLALSIDTVITVHEMDSNIKEIKEMVKIFASMLSPQEREIGAWIEQNGGKDVVLASDKKCAELIKYEAKLTSLSSGQGALSGSMAKMSPEEAKKNEAKAITNLKKEYHEDIQIIIQENLQSFLRSFEMGLDNLNKDLGRKIRHEGDRVIKHLNRGPHSRIKDKMIFHIWKDQGWKGSAKTRSLVLAIRDYLVERVEHEHNKLIPAENNLLPTRSISPLPKDNEDDDEDDPAADFSVPLPDNWIMAYLQVRRLHYLQQAMDPDCSGFTTISELNTFTSTRPSGWSLPRWISYWAIGWQISATKYCIEIEKLYSQMFLLSQKIAIQMPGNKRYVNQYIEYTWHYITALTSSIERYDSPSSGLEEQFRDYNESQEKDIKEGLVKIQYKIDSMDPIVSILHGKQIEQSLLALLTLLLRRHLAKIHLCLKQDVDERELSDSWETILVIIGMVWSRFRDLKDYFLHQRLELKQTFEWYSCGLFKNYHDWDAPTKEKHFRASDMTMWNPSGDTIDELDASELTGILVYTDGPALKSTIPIADTTPVPSSLPTPAPPPSLVDKTSNPPSSATLYPSVAEKNITGVWYGWHWTETEKPWSPLLCVNLEHGGRQGDFENKAKISGHGHSWYGHPWTLTGIMDLVDQASSSLALDFQRSYYNTDIHYTGTFLVNREVIHGTFEHPDAEGWFLFKKVPNSFVMCLRPFKAELNSKELWSFACKAVIYRLKHQKSTLVELHQRMIDVRRLVDLTARDTDEAERIECAQLSRNFSAEELSELYNLLFSRCATARTSIQGLWHGWHWTEEQNPSRGMESFSLRYTDDPDDQWNVETTVLSGEGVAARGEEWFLNGTMCLAEQSIVSWVVKFDRFDPDGTWTGYTGTFLPDRQVITGTFFQPGNAKGRFLFKMVPISAVLCSRPLVAELNTKQCWLFAYHAVRENLRRQQPQFKVYQNIINAPRVLELTWKHPLDVKELQEYSRLIKTFSAEEILNIRKLYLWYSRVDVPRPSLYCDICGDHLKRARVTCLDCTSAEKAEDSVDFCAKESCVASSGLPKRTDVTHLPSHLMMKMRHYFLLKDYFVFKQQATEALQFARQLYNAHVEQNIPPAAPVSAATGQSITTTQTPGGQQMPEVKGESSLKFVIYSRKVLLPKILTPPPPPPPYMRKAVPTAISAITRLRRRRRGPQHSHP
ncbi:hypothetical protein C8R46DRAFT_545436 [Mycena filopes]|nr:hypothetical protein C8R46DRAFT_545436 [Mycena filopes]